MQFIPIKTRKFLPPKDNLFRLMADHLPALKNKDILIITSKIVSIHQGCCVKINPSLPPLQQKTVLIKQQADAFFKKHPHSLTIKDQVLTPYAGIDRSNANGYYILWPKNPHQTAKTIWQNLRQQHHIKQLGIIIADSFCLPLRWGQISISIGFYGFYPNHEYSGQKDIFNQKIVQANSNLIDALTAMAGAYLGQGNEQTPLCLIRGFDKLVFTDKSARKDLNIRPGQTDLYDPLLKHLK